MSSKRESSDTLEADEVRTGPDTGLSAPRMWESGEHEADGLGEIIRAMRWARLRLTIRPEDALRLPPYKGSTFRGAFGHSFKQIACPLRQRCETCKHQSVCVYSYVFETPVRPNASSLARGPFVAHPFVLEPPQTPLREFGREETLDLGLVLIGRAISLAPYFLAACREMGRRGVGQGRGRFLLERAIADDPEHPPGRCVYDGEEELLAPAVPPWSGEDLGGATAALPDRITLEFLTPTRLRQDADLVVRPEFGTLASALLRRVSVLAEAHCGARVALDARTLLAGAGDVKVASADLRWHDWERYSARQRASMALGGFLGRITFAGSLGPWLSLLRLGEVLHVGKGTAFGLGKYRIHNGTEER